MLDNFGKNYSHLKYYNGENSRVHHSKYLKLPCVCLYLVSFHQVAAQANSSIKLALHDPKTLVEVVSCKIVGVKLFKKKGKQSRGNTSLHT